MPESANALSAWESFYVIVGSSGGALIGLQFVVITLIAERRHLATPAALSAFGTPTVVHFAGALIISATMSAPWPSLATLPIALGLCGLIGLAYSVIVVRREWRQTSYKPVWQDWLWFALLPFIAYGALVLTALFIRQDVQAALFVVAGCALGLLLIGIHNAWDSVLHIVVSGDEPQNQRGRRSPGSNT
jgi:hypothetical protein